MNDYEFILKFKLPDAEEDAAKYLPALEAAGCDDAVIGTGQPGRIAFDFMREAETAEDAVYSAITTIHSVIEGAILIDASPDYVGLTDIAGILDLSRQYIRKLIEQGHNTVPSPVYEGSIAIYHFSEILNWLEVSKKRRIEASLKDVANVNRKLNYYKELMSLASSTEKANDCIGQTIPEDVRAILNSTSQLAG